MTTYRTMSIATTGRFTHRILTAVLFGVLSICMAPAQADTANFMIQADVNGQRVEGRPIFWSKSRVQLMLRDGQLLDFPASQATNYRRSADRFRSYTASEIRSRLAAELGRKFEVTGTGHYLVVHPAGEKNRWAARFEDLYRSFVHYFSVRGLPITEPEFPLIAIVWKNKNDYLRYAVRTGNPVGPNVLGYYSPTTNRVHLYDNSNGTTSAHRWQQNAKTIIHEVTHQTAFNTGVHKRFASCPRWVAKGLGTLFEAPGIYDSRHHSTKQDRINLGQLAGYRQIATKLTKADLANMITSDRAFETNTQMAYAQAWAFTFYLMETQPRRYTQYLAKTAEREPGRVHTSTDRLADFTAIFDDNFAMHHARFTRFMAELR